MKMMNCGSISNVSGMGLEEYILRILNSVMVNGRTKFFNE